MTTTLTPKMPGIEVNPGGVDLNTRTFFLSKDDVMVKVTTTLFYHGKNSSHQDHLTTKITIQYENGDQDFRHVVPDEGEINAADKIVEAYNHPTLYFEI